MDGKGPRQMIARMARNMVPSLVVNAVVPFALYLLLKPRFPANSVVPIGIAALFPVLGNVWTLARKRSLDTFGTMMLVGFGITLVTIFVTGNERLVLVSRSALNLAMGLACLVSLALPKTISFYFARQFMTGDDPARRTRFDTYWELPYVRFVSRVTAAVWGSALVGEFLIRLLLVYTQPVPRAVLVTPVVFNLISFTTIAWTVVYGTRAVGRIKRTADTTAPRPSEARA